MDDDKKERGLTNHVGLTSTETNTSAPENRGRDPWRRRFRTWKPPFFRGYVSFRECKDGGNYCWLEEIWRTTTKRMSKNGVCR